MVCVWSVLLVVVRHVGVATIARASGPETPMCPSLACCISNEALVRLLNISGIQLSHLKSRTNNAKFTELF